MHESKQHMDQTLCWDCALATDVDKCPWATNGKPVDGWWAKKNKIRYTTVDMIGKKHTTETDSYTVILCPLFKRDSFRGGMHKDDRRKRRDVLETPSQSDVRALASAIICQAVTDWERTQRGGLRKIVSPENITVKSDELIRFFNSRFFEQMLEFVTDVEPSLAREALDVPEQEPRAYGRKTY